MGCPIAARRHSLLRRGEVHNPEADLS
jgi:hypothetical protein